MNEIYLVKRELAALHLLATYRATPESRIPEGTEKKWKRTLMTTVPTTSYLWTDPDLSMLNIFFRQNAQFDVQMRHPNQVQRVVARLRQAGFVPAGSALTPTKDGKFAHKELVAKCGDHPLAWPDILCYNLSSHEINWEESSFS